MMIFDEVCYHGEHCVCEVTWDDDQGHHMAAIRPDGATGVFVVDQDDTEVTPWAA